VPESLLSVWRQRWAWRSQGAASAVVVGGIDFGSPSPWHLQVGTIAETRVTGVGQELRGFGRIDSINGTSDYCAVDPNCRLFFTVSGYVASSVSARQVEFTGGAVSRLRA